MNTPICFPLYTLNLPKYWFVRDLPAGKTYSQEEENSNRAGLLFHIQQNDYFSTLAAVLRFYEESISGENSTEEMRKLQLKNIKELTNDLLYLEEHYAIVPKEGRE